MQWRLYSGPAPVIFGTPYSASTTVSFSQGGSYTFLLSADDCVHAGAYDAVIVNVQTTPTPTPSPTASALPTVTVAVSPDQIQEGSDATFTVTSSATAAQPITVNYWMGGRAQPGTDYTLDGPAGQVIIPAGQSAASVILHAVADGAKEKNKGAVMHLGSDASYVLPKRASARVIILSSP